MTRNGTVTKHKQLINAFIRDTLGLRLTNTVWSWDAYGTDGVVVMKLWQKNRETLPAGTERIGVWDPVDGEEVTHALKERLNNLKRMKAGGLTYALIRGYPDSYKRDSRVYENDRLYKLRSDVEVDATGKEYAVVERVVTIDEFLNRGATAITAADLIALLASLGATCVITKNHHPESEKNFRSRPRHPGDMLDGYWMGQPGRVVPGAGFAIHLVERNNELWLGDYLGTLDEGEGRFSLIVGDAQSFHITDLDFDNPAQKRLKDVLKQPGAVTYSYVEPEDWEGATDFDIAVDAAPEGPAYKMAQVKQRMHQRAFRAAVFAHHGKKCMVTGCDVEELLEAAHLDGRNWQEGENTAADGVPLRVDIHRAYDRGLLKLDENFQIVDIAPALEEQYRQYRRG
ncbi:HNH endonuclease [Burkholderia cepacia]|uniref:HNH endonuclease n=1 Tax=Burkholderia cepacia TaxID=292 RepID=UPI00352884F9